MNLRCAIVLLLTSLPLFGAGNSVTGVVRFDGPAPKREPIPLTPETRKLYKAPPLKEETIVGSDGGVVNVFVYVKEGLPADKTYPVPEKARVLNQEKSMFRPRVQGVLVGQDLLMRNSDPVIHNVRSLSEENRPFNIGQPANTPDRKKVFKESEGPIEVRCDFHPWMKAFFFVMEHPFFAVTDEKGRFKITNLPDGAYTLAIWHETLGRQEREFTVRTHPFKGLVFTFKPKEKK
jgi:hypothetical protein